MKLKALIVDDERLARKELRSMLENFNEISVIGEADDLEKTVVLIGDLKPDVVFLDIQLRNENGFELFDLIEPKFELIFVTAFDEFAIRAFEINALDYLLKPVNPARLAASIERLTNSDSEVDQTDVRKLDYDDRLLVEVNERSRFLMISEISHISASGNYSEVFMTNGKSTLIEKPLKEWDQRLPEKQFTRIHRSTIINVNEIEKLDTLFNRTMEVKLRKYSENFPVSRRYATRLKEKFG